MHAGNFLCFVGTVTGIANAYYSLSYHFPLKFILLLLSWFLVWYFSHCLSHYLVGTLGGIRFKYYFLGRSTIRKAKIPLISKVAQNLPFVLGIKIDKESISKANPKAIKTMYLAGPLSSMMLPFIIVALSLTQPSQVTLPLLPFTIRDSYILLGLTLANVAFSLYFSPKVGCISKAIKLGTKSLT